MDYFCYPVQQEENILNLTKKKSQISNKDCQKMVHLAQFYQLEYAEESATANINGKMNELITQIVQRKEELILDGNLHVLSSLAQRRF